MHASWAWNTSVGFNQVPYKGPAGFTAVGAVGASVSGCDVIFKFPFVRVRLCA